MNIYEKYCLPHLINLACGLKVIQQQRAKIVPLAIGHVLEVGMGSGLNIPFYNSANVDMVWGLEPSEGMRKIARKNIQQTPFELRWLDIPGEEIPLEDSSIDTVLLTYTLCTIPNWLTALQQMRRVLKPHGKLLFCEHGEAPDKNVLRWQQRINPVWKKIAGGCHLDRPIPDYLKQAGFSIQTMETQYLPSSPKFAGYNYWGIASLPLRNGK